jgi:hypothetical protein
MASCIFYPYQGGRGHIDITWGLPNKNNWQMVKPGEVSIKNIKMNRAVDSGTGSMKRKS